LGLVERGGRGNGDDGHHGSSSRGREDRPGHSPGASLFQGLDRSGVGLHVDPSSFAMASRRVIEPRTGKGAWNR
jgi:hypothetical protein